MKYETPELVVLTSAIKAIQNNKSSDHGDGIVDASPAYEDWE
jgi:hypothetical protein